MMLTNSSMFRANGKLLLTAEYLVLDGAVAFATPLKFGQRLEVMASEQGTSGLLHWESLDHQGQTWFSCKIATSKLQVLNTTDKEIAHRLVAIFKAIKQLNPIFWEETMAANNNGLNLKSLLEFPRSYGWGTSSTLIYTLAKWAKLDPQQLLSMTFGGSGYDIACADANGPILYQRRSEIPHWVDISWSPTFIDQLYLVYLQKKQNSRAGIQRFKTKVKVTDRLIDQFTKLTTAFIQANDGQTLDSIIEAHESIIAQLMDMTPAKRVYFLDFPGAIKSLGAWGGDFVLANSVLGPDQTKAYFASKGFPVCLPYKSCLFDKGLSV